MASLRSLRLLLGIWDWEEGLSSLPSPSYLPCWTLCGEVRLNPSWFYKQAQNFDQLVISWLWIPRVLQLHAFKFSTPNTGIGKLPKCKILTYFSNEFYHLFLDYGTSLDVKQTHTFLSRLCGPYSTPLGRIQSSTLAPLLPLLRGHLIAKVGVCLIVTKPKLSRRTWSL